MSVVRKCFTSLHLRHCVWTRAKTSVPLWREQPQEIMQICAAAASLLFVWLLWNAARATPGRALSLDDIALSISLMASEPNRERSLVPRRQEQTRWSIYFASNGRRTRKCGDECERERTLCAHHLLQKEPHLQRSTHTKRISAAVYIYRCYLCCLLRRECAHQQQKQQPPKMCVNFMRNGMNQSQLKFSIQSYRSKKR